jgi:hypothetical protein
MARKKPKCFKKFVGSAIRKFGKHTLKDAVGRTVTSKKRATKIGMNNAWAKCREVNGKWHNRRKRPSLS